MTIADADPRLYDEPEIPADPGSAPAGGSLRERLAARRRELTEERTFLLAVPGYEDLGLYARYKSLPYEALRAIVKRHERTMDTAAGELALACDVLIHACIELVEKRDDDSYQSLGFRWGPEAAKELFQIDLPEGATVRNAIQEIFAGRSMSLILHYREYDEQMGTTVAEVDDAQVGESAASSDQTSSSWR